MADSCALCIAGPGVPRWRQYAALSVAFVFCPCHLPITLALVLAGLAAAGMTLTGPWVAPVVYGLFTIAFLVSLGYFIALVRRRKDRAAAREEAHAEHSARVVARERASGVAE